MPPVLIPDFVKIKVIKVTNPITIKVNINENTITWIKEAKKKKFLVRKFVKELKRVRWPSSKKSWASFIQVIVF
uniref:preprotein translocase subunit SecE n=1 Tax=Mycoplasmopsis bovis TaxID=28903 RepID=UPI003D28FA12